MAVALYEEEKAINRGRSCIKCIHLPVCTLYRAIAPLLNSFEQRKPFEANELAKICKEFTPQFITQEELRKAEKLR